MTENPEFIPSKARIGFLKRVLLFEKAKEYDVEIERLQKKLDFYRQKSQDLFNASNKLINSEGVCTVEGDILFLKGKFFEHRKLYVGNRIRKLKTKQEYIRCNGSFIYCEAVLSEFSTEEHRKNAVIIWDASINKTKIPDNYEAHDIPSNVQLIVFKEWLKVNDPKFCKKWGIK